MEPKPDDKEQDNPPKPDEKERWTTISFAPTSFFNHADAWIGPDGEGQDTDHLRQWPLNIVHCYSGAAVELHTIIKALKTVETRWRELERYISSLLVQDFMNPKDYCDLLFDDETFTRSRLYFWILGFIIEVQPCIEDNITQWNLYRQARIQSLLEDSRDSPKYKNTAAFDRSSVIRQYDKEGKQIMQDLENLKRRFDAISESVRALRDGVRFTGFSGSYITANTVRDIAIQCQCPYGK